MRGMVSTWRSVGPRGNYPGGQSEGLGSSETKEGMRMKGQSPCHGSPAECDWGWEEMTKREKGPSTSDPEPLADRASRPGRSEHRGPVPPQPLGLLLMPPSPSAQERGGADRGGETRGDTGSGSARGRRPPGAVVGARPSRFALFACRPAPSARPGQLGKVGGGLAGGRGTGPTAAAAFSPAAKFHKAACPASSISINNSWLGRGGRAGSRAGRQGRWERALRREREPGTAAAGGGRK